MAGVKRTATKKTAAKPVPIPVEEVEIPVEETVVEEVIPEPEPKKVTSKKASSKKTAAPKKPVVEVIPEPEPEVEIDVCTEELCGHNDEEEEVVEEEAQTDEVYTGPVVQEEDDDVMEEIEEAEEEEDLEPRRATVPLNSSTSPRMIQRGNRARSPRMGTIMSPKLVMRNKTDFYAAYPHLEAHRLLFDQDDILDYPGFDSYLNVRAMDTITWMCAVGYVPYYFTQDGIPCHSEEADQAPPVQNQQDIDDGFEYFECCQGILVVDPAYDVDFGEDEEYAVCIRHIDGYRYVIPVLSSGQNGGKIRFVTDFEIWGLISVDHHEKIKDTPDYRNRMKSANLLPIDYFDSNENLDAEE